MKPQIPSSNIQRNSNHQVPNYLRDDSLKFDAWSFSGAWMLGLGASASFVLGAFSALNL
jgi:hypothetical protein